MRQDNSIDSNPILRSLHLHCFVHMYRVITRTTPKQYISTPRFKLFKRIERLYHSKQQYNLFKNLIFTFLTEVILAIIITIISSSLNLLVPQLIRQFMHFMREKHLQEKQYGNFIYVFIVIQFLRVFFSAHSKRLFHELAIKVESTLARKLISKSLRMTKECRDRIPDSELIQLQNVDLKLIFTLFKNMDMIFEAPFTIIVSIILLFNESSHYGFIGIYWFMIAFLLQRELDGRMTLCNRTKLKLIEQRSNLNYHLLDKFKGAKLIGWEDIITEQNNDLFIEENHDHSIFYSYVTYYDITLLMLPIFVVATITLFDSNEDDPITVQQVYLMLSLLGICYNPMKSMRMISINMHDGLHSLSRLSKYFHFPESTKSSLIEKKGRTGEIIIFQGTEAMHPHSSSDFNVHITEEIVVEPGERLILLGKKHSGRSSFLQMLVGNMKRVKGKISITGKISFCPEKPFLMKDTVKENIRFFNENLSDLQIEQIYNQLGLFQQFSLQTNLDTVIDDKSKFTKSTLKKIALARCLCAEADIYILNNPFIDIDEQYATIIEKRLRDLQDRNKTIVLSLTRLAIADQQDQIIILEDGEIAQYDYFDVLVNSTESQIRNYFELQEDDIGEQFQPQTARKILGNFSKRIESVIKFDLRSATLRTGRRMIPRRFTAMSHSPLTLLSKREMTPVQVNKGFEAYLLEFMTSVNFRESIFIFFIILAAEVLHIFIHFYIGHLQEENAKDDYTKYKNLMIMQVLLTFCLAGLIYLEGQFSTLLAIIIGNRIYKESFKELTNKSIVWFNNQYNVKLADRYNHDYEEIYIACHSIFGIYKNLVILIATIQFISTNRSKLMAIFVVLAAIYYSIFLIFRKIQRKIVQNFFNYKYNFVRCLEQSIQGAELMNITQCKKQFMARAQYKYKQLASYKLSASYTTYGLSIVCDILSISLLAIGIEYGIEMKAHNHNQSISIIATSIFLLMNISEVLKTIIWEMLNFQTFFNINIVPFLEIKHMTGHEDIEQQMPVQSLPHLIRFSGHALQFKNLFLQEDTQMNRNFEPLSFTIQEGEIVLIYEKNHRYRDIFLMALTKNLAMQHTLKRKSSNICLGGISIKDIPRVEWLQNFGLIMQQNFFFIGSIKDNISWRLPQYNHEQAKYYARMLKLYKDYPMLATNILDAKLNPEHRSTSSLVKKITILRILLRKPNVIIMKDIEEYIDGVYIIELLKQELPKATIIKISRSIEQSFDVDKIIALDKMELQEYGTPSEIKANFASKVGKQLKEINLKSYAFSKRISKKIRSIRTVQIL